MKYLFITLIFLLVFSGNIIALSEPDELTTELLEFKFKLKDKSQSELLNNKIYKTNYNLNNKLNASGRIKEVNKVKPWRLALLGVVGAGVFTGMHIYYKNTWWKDQRNFFKYAEDGYYARDVDKISHVYTASTFTTISAIAYEWTGISPDNALWYGAATALAYETYIEINDGFAPNWGFDWVDVGANIFGAAYPILQKEIPVLKNFTFKWSFDPQWIKGKVENTDDLLDDYTNMTFWLGINPTELLPSSWRKYYPSFLGVAIGLSINNASHVIGSRNANQEWYLSLDYDITKLPGETDFLKKLKKILNFYHFPAPAVRISPDGVWYGIYF